MNSVAHSSSCESPLKFTFSGATLNNCWANNCHWKNHHLAIAYIQSSSCGFLLHQANVENSDDITYLDIHVAIGVAKFFT
jgi:hypothetical protein